MKKNIIILFSVLLLLTACIFEKEEKKDKSLDKLPSDELKQMAWEAFLDKNYEDSEIYFSVLARKADAYLYGHYGLGWTFLKTYKYQNAKNEFNKFIILDSLNIYNPTDSIFIDVKAGQTITFNALSEHLSAITASNSVPATWVFKYDSSLNIIDIRLLRAVSQYALGRFQDALNTVRLVDPNFDADIETVEGRIRLMQKIESLLIQYG